MDDLIEHLEVGEVGARSSQGWSGALSPPARQVLGHPPLSLSCEAWQPWQLQLGQWQVSATSLDDCCGCLSVCV